MPWDDAGLLVVPGSIASQLQDLSSQVFHDCCHVHWGTSSNPLGIVTLPTHKDIEDTTHTRKRPNLSSLWILPTGNWSPALLERDLAFPLTLPPLPRPDMLAEDVKRSENPPGVIIDTSKDEGVGDQHCYFELVYLVTALVPSDTACLANSPGRRRRTAVWISREVMVDLELIIINGTV